MVKPLRGEREIQLGGEKFTLRLALGDLEEIETQLGTGIVAVLARFTMGQARLSDARVVLRQGFKGAGLKITEQRLGALMEKTGLQVVREAADLLISTVADEEGNAVAVDQAASQ